MADNKFLLYELIKNDDKFNSNLEFQDNQLITRAAFEDMLDTDNYSWSGEKYQQNQFVYEYEIDNVSKNTLPNFDDYIEIVGGEVDPYHEYLYVQTETYKNGNQFCEFEIKMKGDTVLIYGEDYQITSRGDSFEVIPDTDPNSPNVTVKMYGTDVQNYYVHITPIENYQGEIVLEFIINKKSISDAEYSYENVTYNGQAQLPIFTFDFGTDIEGNEWKITSQDETMFSQTPDEQTNAGNYRGTFIVSFQNKNYTGQIPVRWTIEQQSTEINITNDSITADGSGHGFEVTNNSFVDGTIYYVITTSPNWPGNYDSDEQIEANSTITIGNVSTIGTHYIWAYFEPNDTNYSDSESKMGTLTITEPDKIDISDYTVNLSQDTYVYNGTEQKPEVTVSYDNQTLTAADYDVEYPNDSTSAGTKTITITGKGNYTGRTTANYKIEKANPNVQLIGLEAPFNHNYQYCEAKNISSSSAHSTSGILYYGLDNGDGQRPMDKSVELNIGDTVKLNALLIGDSGEYTIWGVFIPTDQNNWNTLQNLTCILKITPITLTSSNTQITLTPDTFVYDGNPKTPEVSLVYDYYTGVDITPTNVTYQNNTNAGDHPNSATAIIEVNTRNYIGTLTAQFTINKADLNLDIGFGITYDDVSNNLLADYDSNKAYTTFYTVYDDDGYAIKGTIHYEITTEEIEHATPNMLTNSSSYTETGRYPGYIWIDGGNTEYTDAGEYYLYAYFESNNNNYKDTDIENAQLIIRKADSDIQITVKNNLIYNTQNQELVSVSNPHNLNIRYLSSDHEINEFNQGTSFSAYVPSYTDVCTKYIYYKFNGDDNYEAIEPTLAGICTISPYELTQDNTAIQGGNYTYTGSSIEPAHFINVKEFASGSNLWLIYRGTDYDIVGLDGNSPVRTDAGTYQVRIRGRNNYRGDFTVPFVINKATLSAPSMSDITRYFSYEMRDSMSGATYTVTNNNQVNCNITGSINVTYEFKPGVTGTNGEPTYNTTYVVNKEINANTTQEIATNDYTVGTYVITIKFTPKDTDATNYIESSQTTATLTIEPDVTDIWISDKPASSFDPDTATTGRFEITQGQSLQLYVVGEESGWYSEQELQDSQYVEITEEITTAGGATTGQNVIICTINNNELYGENIGASSGSSSNPNGYALHVEYRNDNNVVKSHSSNVTVTSAREYLGRYAYYQDTTTQVDEITFRYTGGSSSYDIEICDVYNNNGTREYENVVDASLFDSMSCNSNGDIRVLSNGNTKTIIENTNNRTLVYIEYNESEGGNYITISRGQPVTNSSENITLDIDFEQLDHTIAINVVY